MLISTDKAVNPTNVMGASKRAAEMVLSHLAHAGPRHPFRRGALRQRAGLERQRDPEVQGADRQGRPDHGHPPGDHPLLHDHPRGRAPRAAGAAPWRAAARCYVLDMGEPVKIVDLARDLIRLSGHSRRATSPIVFSGLRPGEKLYEELLADADDTLASKHPRLRIARLQERAGGRVDAGAVGVAGQRGRGDRTGGDAAGRKRFVPEYEAPDSVEVRPRRTPAPPPPPRAGPRRRNSQRGTARSDDGVLRPQWIPRSPCFRENEAAQNTRSGPAGRKRLDDACRPGRLHEPPGARARR